MTRCRCCSVAQSCPILCDLMACSTLGLPVHHHLPEFAQTHVHWVNDAIQPSHPLSLPSSCPQSFPASGSCPVSRHADGGCTEGASNQCQAAHSASCQWRLTYKSNLWGSQTEAIKTPRFWVAHGSVLSRKCWETVATAFCLTCPTADWLRKVYLGQLVWSCC